ncbi:MAG TPA: glycoside hydrolase family 88 protein [Verrucomicrobiae bacterium]|nr:glycoside hydrolase family 88 protein [Verrucomicrobiae bacterium]
MKTNIGLFQTVSSGTFPVLLALLLLNSGGAARAQNPTNASLATATVAEASGGITDAEIRDVIERVARHQLQPLADGEYPAVTNLAEAEAAKAPEGIAWNYPQGVMLYGMERSADVSGDKDVDEFAVEHSLVCARYNRWLAGLEKQFGTDGENLARRSKIRGLINLGNLDSCGAMGNAMLVSMMRHPDRVTPEEKAVVARIADWVVNKQDRLPDGTLWRAKEMGGTIWPDDLYMGGVFLVRYGIYTHERKYVDDAANNIIHQAALEQDSDGLWFHGYFMKEKKHAPFKWGRGNGWATVALVETLSALPADDPLRPPLLDILRKQIEGLKKVQASDGMWRQVLDKPESWEETSCTAMFAYGIARAVNRGWIDASNLAVARRAFAGIAKNVTPDGEVNGTCQGTNIGTTLDFYLDRQRPDNDPHGRGPVMLAGTEILMAGRK